jgi:translation initiation factor 4A
MALNDFTEATGVEEEYTIVEYDNFDDIPGINEKILNGIYSMGFDYPSPIQSKGIKVIMDHRDFIAQAQSGTGKTATFIIGALHNVDLTLEKPQVIILCHNRELAQQIYFNLEGLNSKLNAKIALISGGTSVHENFKQLDNGAQIIVGTPGRIYDMMNKRYALRTDNLKVLIMDEADEMLSKGFKDQVLDIFQYIPKDCQICLFSATMNEATRQVAHQFMENPIEILVNQEKVNLDGIKQYYLAVEHETWKLATLYDLYEKLRIKQTIIFCNSRRKAEWLKDELEKKNFTVACIHGEMKQLERDIIMKAFRKGEHRILISTDVLSRGIDVQQVSLVINFDIPRFKETYIHRIGRSGRFGRKGVAINFVSERDFQQLKRIEEYYSINIESIPKDIKNILSS